MGAKKSLHWLISAAERGGLGNASESTCTPETDIAEAWTVVGEFLKVDQPALRDAVARVFGIPIADFEGIEPEARTLLPHRAAQALLVAPLRSTDRNLVVATADPANVELEQEVTLLSGRPTIFEVATPDQIHEALATAWGSKRGEAALRLVEPQDDGLTKRHILVVDDDPVGRFLIRSVLEQRGFEVSEADDGATAQPLIDSDTHFDLLLLDLMMEHVDGKAVLRSVRENPIREHLPVVILTGSQDPEDESQLIRIGADDYLRKPVDPEQLILRIEAVLKRAQTR